MALKLLIKANAENAPSGTVPARSFTIHVVDDSTDPATIAPIGTYGAVTISLGDTAGTDGNKHEIKLRQVDVPVTVDGQVNCNDWAAIVLMSEPFLK